MPRLRQVVLAARELEPATEPLRAVLDLGAPERSGEGGRNHLAVPEPEEVGARWHTVAGGRFPGVV